MPYALSLNPIENPALLGDIVGTDEGCEVFVGYCGFHTSRFAWSTGLSLVSFDRDAILRNEQVFWKELDEIGTTNDPFLVAAALYRVVCLTEPFRLVRSGEGPLIHPIVARHTNAAAGLRLCYELGQAMHALGIGVGSLSAFERLLYAHSERLIAEGARWATVDVAGHFNQLFSSRLGFLSTP